MNDQQKAILVLKALEIRALSNTHFTPLAMQRLKTIAAGKDADGKAANDCYFLSHAADLVTRPVNEHEQFYGKAIEINLN